jgi:hypothetical protein
MPKKHITLLALASVALATLSACKGSTAQPLEQSDDWIKEPTVSASPTPTPTPTPSPTQTTTPTALYSGPEEVAKYVQKFVDDGKAQGRDVTENMSNPPLTIRLASLDSYGSSVIGLCESGAGIRRVTFDPDFWNSVSETQRELLAHHELGHCVLYRGHRSDVLSSGAYASIMYPVIMGSSTYTGNYDYYQNELFTWTSAAMAAEAASDTVKTHICTPEELASGH